MIHRNILGVLFASLALAQVAWAQQIETDPQTGVQYQVTRQVYKRPVSETHIEQRPYVAYSEQQSIEYQPSYHTVYTPVTEYSWEPYMANRWNPFSSPTVGYHYVAHTRWDTRTEVTQVPLTRHDFVPEQHMAQVPVTTQRLVDEEHITRVALSGGSGTDPFTNRTVANGSSQIGGVALQQDPPKAPANVGIR
ncbi:MAG TPA: hypothetical protein VFE46_05505 [Pirellulales bacterium]|jgi:hypothetical protein|nr:hypothetical protein [Pirellulales bacterium]